MATTAVIIFAIAATYALGDSYFKSKGVSKKQNEINERLITQVQRLEGDIQVLKDRVTALERK